MINRGQGLLQELSRRHLRNISDGRRWTNVVTTQQRLPGGVKIKQLPRTEQGSFRWNFKHNQPQNSSKWFASLSPFWGGCRAERHFFTSAGWMGPGLCTQLPHESHGSGGQGWQGPRESPRPKSWTGSHHTFPSPAGSATTDANKQLSNFFHRQSRSTHSRGQCVRTSRTSHTSRTSCTSLLDRHLASSSGAVSMLRLVPVTGPVWIALKD